MDHLVLTVIATDHPGLVERIAQCIASHGGNWLESRMSRMAGQFAGILRVAVPAEGYDELVEGATGPVQPRYPRAPGGKRDRAGMQLEAYPPRPGGQRPPRYRA